MEKRREKKKENEKKKKKGFYMFFKNPTTNKFFFTTFTVSYSKIYYKHLKKSSSKQALNLALMKTLGPFGL